MGRRKNGIKRKKEISGPWRREGTANADWIERQFVHWVKEMI